MNRLVVACLAGAAALIASCAPRPQPPQPAPPPAAPERPPVSQPAPPPPPAPADWRDAPLSPGDWSWSAPASATFASGGVPALVIRCEAPGRISLIRSATGGSRMTIRTSFGDRSLTALPVGNGLRASVAAGDPLLDQIAFSRGRFLVETDGAPALIVPAWPEPARVVEDCRA